MTSSDAPTLATPRLTISGLRVSLPGPNKKAERKQVLERVDLTLRAGQIAGVAGESGSGKTMTGLAVLGLLPNGADEEGTIDFGGQNLLTLGSRELNEIRGREIAMVFQDPSTSMHPMIKIGVQLTDHMRKHLGLSKKAAMARAVELLDMVQIPTPADALSKYPHQFSGGMRQRIAIAVALACDPKVLIADEPTTALDVTVQAGILRLLRRLCDELGVAIMLVTHDLGVMSAVADDVTVMRHGAVVEHGPRFDVLTNPTHPYTRELIASLPGNRIANPIEHGHPGEIRDDMERSS